MPMSIPFEGWEFLFHHSYETRFRKNISIFQKKFLLIKKSVQHFLKFYYINKKKSITSENTLPLTKGF